MRFLNEAFDWLGPDIVLAHAKDPTYDSSRRRVRHQDELAGLSRLRMCRQDSTPWSTRLHQLASLPEACDFSDGAGSNLERLHEDLVSWPFIANTSAVLEDDRVYRGGRHARIEKRLRLIGVLDAPAD